MIGALQEQLQLAATPYTFARLAAWTSAVALVTLLNRQQGIAAGRTVALAGICSPLSILGARVLDALEYAGAYPSLAAAMARNGSSIYGGLVLVFGAVYAYAAWLRFPTLRLLDAASPGIALGESVSRIGCFLAGCCYGIPWDGPWAVTFARDSFAFRDQVGRGLVAATAAHAVPVHPVQLYSVVLAFAIAVWLVHAFVRRRWDGAVFYRLLIGYGGLRLAIAPLRIEALGSMKLFSIAFIAAGTIGLLAGARRGRPVALDRVANVA